MKVSEISKEVFDRLKSIVKNTYPVVAPEGTKLPYAVYNINSCNIASKDDATKCSINVNIYAKAYADTIDLAESVIELFQDDSEISGFRTFYVSENDSIGSQVNLTIL